ncbi:ATP-binding protein [Mucilaginibacter sp. CAU 1740]|uniref:HD domain-containing protein n=1 Tax=Mucilaginibacter sp. CAU 1740 TaxID=3140365 RepID=UPI00325B0149
MTKIDNSLKFDELELVKYLTGLNSSFLPVVTGIYNNVKDSLDNRIPAIFPKYTLHNTSHSFRIINYMAKLVANITELSELEITLLICAALLHDVGMAISEADIELIKRDDFPFSNFKYSTMLRLMDNDDVAAIQEYVRRIHADLSGRYIRENLKSILVIPDLASLDYTEELALICESHTKDYDWIKAHLNTHDIRGNYSFNAQFISCILRLGDILDIDGNRTPYKLYELIAPKGKSDEEWRQHFVIFNNDKIVENEKTHQRNIVFHGKSKNADIHRKILTYIDWVETELVGAIALVSSMKNQYNLPFDEKPKVNIQTEGYTFSGYKMTLKFEAISSLLMGEKIYGNKSLGLRELIQNSLDACRIRQENEKIAFGDDPYEPRVRVIIDKEKSQVIIKDNGVGMSIDIIKNHFLNIGVSYYQSFEFLLKDLAYKPIGNYGIGFLSCFMLSDKVTVRTRHYQSKFQYLIQLEKGNEWTSLTEKEDITFFGTEVILSYTPFIGVFENQVVKVKEFLSRFFLTDGINFKLLEQPETQFDIKNELFDGTPAEKGFIKIWLSDYLNDIEGYALIRNKTNFITSFNEIPLDEEIYRYNPPKEYPEESEEEDDIFTPKREWLVKVSDISEINIDDYTNVDEIKYLTIPIIDSDNDEDFSSGMKFTGDDTKEVIEKLEDQLNWITILIPKEYQKNLREEEITKRNEFLDNVTFEDLVDIGQLSRYPTYVFVETTKLFEGRKNELYLPFEISQRPYWYYSSPSSPRKELFIRNVLIKDFHFNLPVTASVFDIATIVTNIKSRKFIPDISRNNIDNVSDQMINYIISKAIHLGAIDKLGYETDERKTLIAFVEKFYSSKTEFEKD